MVEEWKDAENEVQKHFEKQGYTVLNQNDKGFPDLIILKNGKIVFFIEVKAMQKPDINIYEMQYHQYLNELGFEVKCINVQGKDVDEFRPDPEYESAVKETNPLLAKN